MPLLLKESPGSCWIGCCTEDKGEEGSGGGILRIGFFNDIVLFEKKSLVCLRNRI
jgi:hypothetical protein